MGFVLGVKGDQRFRLAYKKCEILLLSGIINVTCSHSILIYSSSCPPVLANSELAIPHSFKAAIYGYSLLGKI